jgi:hypothetical protein
MGQACDSHPFACRPKQGVGVFCFVQYPEGMGILQIRCKHHQTVLRKRDHGFVFCCLKSLNFAYFNHVNTVIITHVAASNRGAHSSLNVWKKKEDENFFGGIPGSNGKYLFTEIYTVAHRVLD